MSIFRTLGYLLGLSARKGKAMPDNRTRNIANAVIEYVNMNIGREFHAKDLRAFVLGKVGQSAPASADRIMRQLRKQGVINYTLVSRTQSLYRGDRPAGYYASLDTLPGYGSIDQQ